MSLQLTVMSLDFDSLTPPQTKSFAKKEITIGRSPTNDLILDTPEVSGHHAKLRVVTAGEKARLFITDLGSTNGTLVENIPLADRVEIPLATNERVRIGNYLLKPVILSDEFEDDTVLNQKTVPEFKATRTEEINPELLQAVREQTMVMEKSDLLKPIIEKSSDANGHHHTVGNAESSGLIQRAHELSTAATASLGERTLEDERKPAAEKTVVSPSHSVGKSIDSASQAASVIGKAVGQRTLTFDFTATELFSLTGKVLHKGKPLAGVSIDGGALGVTTTDGSGTFSFNDITEGTPFDIKASKTEYRITGLSRGNLSKSTELSLSALQLFTISGKITHHGKPLAGVVVNGGPLGKTTTEADGSYVFKEVLEDTDFNITVEKEGFRFTTK